MKVIKLYRRGKNDTKELVETYAEQGVSVSDSYLGDG